MGIGYGGFYPCSGLSGGVYTLAIPTTTLSPANGSVQPGYSDVSPPVMPREDGTYPYNGGPKNPVPNPGADPAPMKDKQRTVPLEGRSVSLPKSTSKWTFPAYGEAARRTSNVEDRTYYTKKTEAPRSGSR
jgi:hypothetical protein